MPESRPVKIEPTFANNIRVLHHDGLERCQRSLCLPKRTRFPCAVIKINFPQTAAKININQHRCRLFHRHQGAVHDAGSATKRLLPGDRPPLHPQHFIRSLRSPNSVQSSRFCIAPRFCKNGDRVPMRLHQTRQRQIFKPHVKQSPMPFRTLPTARQRNRFSDDLTYSCHQIFTLQPSPRCAQQEFLRTPTALDHCASRW